MPSFYQWRRKLADRSASTETRAADSTRVAADSTDAAAESTRALAAFAPVRLVSSASVSVSWPGGTRFEIPRGDQPTLQGAIETLARIDAEWAARSQTGGARSRTGGASC